MKFEMYCDLRNEYRWRLATEGGRILAVSGRGFLSKRECLNDIILVQNSGNAAIEDHAILDEETVVV
ncbi:MAG TPA: DUF1508 domain-containing protein [Desulfomonilaceae bacterium]|nr:DUF1508 domain-containing protein [Desulfomonilaceae bacterium]